MKKDKDNKGGRKEVITDGIVRDFFRPFSDKIIMLNCYKSTEENVKKLANPPSFL